MAIAYFDCFSGAAGDMIVAALLDAGASFEDLKKSVRTLPISGYTLAAERINKQGIAATRFIVALESNAKQPHRHLKHVVEIINAGKLADRAKDRAIRIFTRLAEAEAAVHGTTVEKVHFHEVGAVDAIVDVVGACVAIELLDVEKVVCSPIPTGSGTVVCEHGVLPVPGPATANLLRGVPLAPTDEIAELTTPTGAAILTTLATSYGPLPAMTPGSIGYGAGTREGKTRPNILRVFVGPAAMMPANTGQIIVLETSIDDATPQIVAHCLERLMAEGALDAYCMPIHMKKWRTGVLLTALCPIEKADTLERIVFEETPTLGIRRRISERRTLPRRVERVSTQYGDIRVKIAGDGSTGALTVTPEYEDCHAAALEHKSPIREVIAAAESAWRVMESARSRA